MAKEKVVRNEKIHRPMQNSYSPRRVVGTYGDLVDDGDLITGQLPEDENNLESQVIDDEYSNNEDSNFAEENVDDENKATLQDNSVTKGLTENTKAYNSYINNYNGQFADEVSAQPYTMSDKLVRIYLARQQIDDTIVCPIDAPIDLVTLGGRSAVGELAYSKNLGELVLFNGAHCTKRTYQQGAALSQDLDRRTCRQLRKEMLLLRVAAEEQAEGAYSTGGQTTQSIANPFGQSTPFEASNSFGSNWAAPDSQYGSVNPFGNAGVNGLQNTLYGTNPYGQSYPAFGTGSGYGANTQYPNILPVQSNVNTSPFTNPNSAIPSTASYSQSNPAFGTGSGYGANNQYPNILPVQSNVNTSPFTNPNSGFPGTASYTGANTFNGNANGRPGNLGTLATGTGTLNGYANGNPGNAGGSSAANTRIGRRPSRMQAYTPTAIGNDLSNWLQ